MKSAQWLTSRSLGLLSLTFISACANLQTSLPEDIAIAAHEIQSGDTAASEDFVNQLENKYLQYEREGEWYQAVQLTALGLRVLPDEPRLTELYKLAETQLETAKLYLAWERLISETRQQLTQRELLRSEAKLRPASDFHEWQLTRINDSIDASADRLRQCGLQSIENQQWQYAEDCLILAAHIRSHEFVEKELAQLKDAKSSPSPTIKTTNPLQERRLVITFNQALKESNLIKARATLWRLQQLNTVHTDSDALLKQLNAAINQRISELEEEAAEHYRNQEYLRAKKNWQLILKLQPDNQEATERLKRVDKVLHSLEELQSETDIPTE